MPAGPSMVPTQSNKFASDLGNADYTLCAKVNPENCSVCQRALTIPGDEDILGSS